MTKETFLLCFVLGAGALAAWVAYRLPALTPRSLRTASVHLALALLVGSTLGETLRVVPGQPAPVSVFTALFAIALPALTYMLLAGMWLMLVVAGNPLARRR